MKRIIFLMTLLSTTTAYGQANNSLSNLSGVSINTELTFADASGVPHYLRAVGADSLILQTGSNENGAGGIVLDSANSVVVNANGNGNMVFNANNSININTLSDFVVMTTNASVFYGESMIVGTDHGLQLAPNAAAPTCTSGYAGTLYYAAGGTGIADQLTVCMKDAADNYAWKNVQL